MKFEHMDLRLGGPVATITLDRSTKLTAIALTMVSELNEAAARISESDARTVVFCGTGTSFSAGMDIETFSSDALVQPDAYMEKFN